MRSVRPCFLILLLGAAACRGPADDDPPHGVPEAGAMPQAADADGTPAPSASRDGTPPRPDRSQAPPGSGPTVMLATVSLQDRMSDEEIRYLLASHGVDGRGIGGSGSSAFAIPQSQAAFAADLLRRDGPRRGRWQLAPGFAVGFQPEEAPPETEWPVLAADIPFDEALGQYPEGTPAGELLRHPVVRAWGRVFTHVRSLRGFARPYRDAALEQHEGLDGKVELCSTERRGAAGIGDFMGFFQVWEGGSRVEVVWWAMGTVPEPDPAPGARLVPVAGVNVADPRSVEWMLRTLQDAGIAASPVQSDARPDEQAFTLFGVAASDASRARKLLRADKPEWASVELVGK